MDQNQTALERAFELAKSGRYRNVADIRTKVRMEGYTEHQLMGKALSKQLAGIIEKARADAQSDVGSRL